MTSPPVSAELATMLRLLKGAVLVNVGHGRDHASAARAGAFLDTWEGDVGAVVSWPWTAASWLRPVRRLASGSPDAWVIADEVAGWRGLGPRLAATGTWRAADTVAFAGLADPVLSWVRLGLRHIRTPAAMTAAPAVPSTLHRAPRTSLVVHPAR